VQADMLSSTNGMDGLSVAEFLHVRIAGLDILMHLSAIREIVRPKPVTPVPFGPDQLLGVAHIHGQVVSLIDVATACNLTEAGDGNPDSVRFLLLSQPGIQVAIRVDKVSGIRKLALTNEQIVELEQQGTVLGSLEVADRSWQLMNAQALLSGQGITGDGYE